ncbi:MAG: hypothetical protein A3F72_09830 [Bacteroidetes bacterium RIFCSPLOWO2_12_FULL_35_15]|nr:MAG: hypothetical protein A3F72_09830 [Bacteroidetes bacterium RIFCSPLOWO2_12_FULL_35_15]
MKTKNFFLAQIAIIVVLLIIILPTISLAQPQWQQVAKRTQAQKTAGLAGGEGWQRVTSASYAPSNANIVYSCLDTDGAWKSTDGGTSWIKKTGGFPAIGGLSLAVDPTNANIVYVAGSSFLSDNGATVEGVIRTADGGNTWTLVKACHFHAAYTYGGHHIAFGTNTTNIYAAPSTGGILKSTNGTTWNLLLTSGGASILSTLNLYSIQAHPTDNTILFVSATNGLYKIVDNGASATVTQVGAGLPAGSVYQVQIIPSTPNTMYIAAGANGVYRSTDGGLNFSARNNGLSSVISAGGQAKYIAMSPANSNRLFVTFENTGTGLF